MLLQVWCLFLSNVTEDWVSDITLWDRGDIYGPAEDGVRGGLPATEVTNGLMSEETHCGPFQHLMHSSRFEGERNCIILCLV